MGIADALGPLLDKPKRRDAQTPKRSGVETANHPTAQRSRIGDPDKRPELPLQGTAKSRHPDFAKKTLYLRKSTMRDAMRRYEDEGGVEESELVEMLLRKYAGVKHA